MLADHQRLDRHQEAASRDKIVERLHRLSGPDRAYAMDRRAHRFQNWIDAVERIRVAASHDREVAGNGARHATRDWRIEHGHAPRNQSLGDCTRCRRCA